METVVLNLSDAEKILRKVVREVMQDELMKLRASILPYISEEEQEEIEMLYKEPSKDVDKIIEIEI